MIICYTTVVLVISESYQNVGGFIEKSGHVIKPTCAHSAVKETNYCNNIQ